MANGTQLSSGLTDEELDQLEKRSGGLTDAQLDNLAKSTTLRPLTRRERQLTQMVQAPKEVWADVLTKKGIDPASKGKFDITATPANIGRAAAMTAGGMLGSAGGPLGAIAGAGGGMALADLALLEGARGQAGLTGDTVGLEDVINRVGNDYPEYLSKSATAGMAAEASGQLINPALGLLKGAPRQAGKLLSQTANRAAATQIGSDVLGALEPILGPVASTVKSAYYKATSIPGNVSDFLLENVARYSKRASDYLAERGWTKTMHSNDGLLLQQAANKARKPVNELTQNEVRDAINRPDETYALLAGKVKNELMPHLRDLRKNLGTRIKETKQAAGLFDPNVTIDFSAPDAQGATLLTRVDELLKNYTSLTPADEEAIVRTTNELMGAVFDENGKLAGYTPISYKRANGILNELKEKLAKPYTQTGPYTLQRMQSSDAIAAQLRGLANERVYALSDDLGRAADTFSNYMKLTDALERYIGFDEQQLTNFVAADLMADPSRTTNYFGQKAFEDILLSEGPLGARLLDNYKQLALQFLGKGGDVQTAGVKTFAIPAVGGAIGGEAGRTAGVLTTLTHYTPRLTSITRQRMEQVGSAIKVLKEGVNTTVGKYSPNVARAVVAVKGRPILNAFLDLTERFYQEEAP